MSWARSLTPTTTFQFSIPLTHLCRSQCCVTYHMPYIPDTMTDKSLNRAVPTTPSRAHLQLLGTYTISVNKPGCIRTPPKWLKRASSSSSEAFRHLPERCPQTCSRSPSKPLEFHLPSSHDATSPLSASTSPFFGRMLYTFSESKHRSSSTTW